MTATRINSKEWTETIDGWTVRHLEYGNGLVEIFRDFYVSNGTWSAWANIYELKITDTVSYPFTFKYRPSIRVEPYMIGNAIMGIEIGPNISTAYTTMPYIYVLRPSAAGNNNFYGVTVYVTGTKA